MAVLICSAGNQDYKIITYKSAEKRLIVTIEGEEVIGEVDRQALTRYRNSVGREFTAQVAAIRDLVLLHHAKKFL